MTQRRRVPPSHVLLSVLVFAIGVGVVLNLLVGIATAYLVSGVAGSALGGLEGPAAAFEARQRLEHATTSVPVTVVSMALTFLGFSLSGFGAAWFARMPVRETLGLRAPRRLATFPLAALGILCLGPISDRLVALAEQLAPDLSLGALQNLEAVVLATPLPLGLVLFALMPGVSEELLCRGLVQRAIAAPGWSIAVSALVFAAMHVDPHHVLGVLPLGVYLAWLAHRTGSTLVTMGAHAANNAVAVVLAHTAGASSTEHVPWPFVLVGALAAAAVIAGIARLEPPVGEHDPVGAPHQP